LYIAQGIYSPRNYPRSGPGIYYPRDLLINGQLLNLESAPENSAVSTTSTQITPSTAKLTARPLALGLLILALLLAAILFVPGSRATRQTPAASSAENQSANGGKRRRPEFVPGEALVRFKKDRAFEGVTQVAVPDQETPGEARQRSGPQGLAATPEQIPVSVERFEGSDLVDGLRLVRMAPADTGRALAALAARDDVIYAAPNYILQSDRDPNDPLYLPLDPSSFYGLKKIGAPLAWDTVTGNRSVVVGVIDTGIDINHPDLQANIWTNPNPGSIAGFGPKVQLANSTYTVSEGDGAAVITVKRDPGDLHGFDFVNNSGTIPAESHATHVAGTIGAVGNNGIGVVGVNWQVSLMSLRFINQATNNGTDADAIRAYNYARQMRELWVSSNGTSGANVRVLNASYGGGGYSQAAADAINAVGQSGILFVAAAGNTSTNNDVAPHYPSSYSLPNVIAVTGTNSSDAQVYNFGARSVMIGAPASGILSTLPGNAYGSLSGTSMATPHVTGAAALLCAANPNLSVNQLRALLSFNGDSIPALQGKTLTGRRLNVSKSIDAMSENDTTPPGTPTTFQITSQTGRTVNLSWVASGDDGATGTASLYDLSFVDQTTSSVIPLSTITPANSGAVQTLTVKIPYRHTAGTIRLREFDNVGNEGTPATLNVTVDILIAEPYIPSTTAPAALSNGGSGLSFNCDDCFKTTTLPFSFPYFGTNLTAVKISSNGNIYFEPPTAPTRGNGDADDVPSSVADLAQYRVIAGMWDDLDLRTSRRADADVFVVSPDANRVIFRWQGVQFGDGTTGGPINFEIELNSNGVIKTRYGSGNTNLLPVVGISGGEPDVYSISTHTSELSPISLTNANSVVFTPRSLGPIAPPEQPSNPPQNGAPSPDAPPQSTPPLAPAAVNTTVAFATSDAAGAQNCNLVNGNASTRCDYMTVLSTITFAPEETSRTVSIPIFNDLYQDGNETFTVTLSNVSGATLGAQTTATVTITDNDASPPTSNPLDSTGFFVRQHYLDFLNREPDTPGFNFWTSQIDNCSPKPQCTEVARVNASASFFESIEFLETGYLVYRFYKASYGDGSGTSTCCDTAPRPISVPIVRLNEFLPDTQRIGQGVVVLVGNWQQQLENNKQAFAEEFVQRPRFLTDYPLTLTPALFVDGLNAKAATSGVSPLSPSERDQLVNELTGGNKTRAQVLRAVAEDQTLFNAEKSRAYVLMQYFGYLRRNPNDPQDTNHTGYDFWLLKLNLFNGNAINAEMVKAFLTSVEYRQRVGP
jgi:subtilisin family serine protease